MMSMLESKLMAKKITMVWFQINFDWVMITDLQSLKKITMSLVKPILLYCTIKYTVFFSSLKSYW